jgi:5-methylcytosine-specific restriction endonuclease McrA
MRRTFSRKQRLYLAILAGFRCEACGEKLTQSLHGDHVQPFSKGGLTHLRNGQALCRQCNLMKGDGYERYSCTAYMAEDSTR